MLVEYKVTWRFADYPKSLLFNTEQGAKEFAQEQWRHAGMNDEQKKLYKPFVRVERVERSVLIEIK